MNNLKTLSPVINVDYDNPMAERGTLYSTPGGLMRTAERFVPGIGMQTRKIEGHPAVFEYLAYLDESLKSGVSPTYYKLVDCLNCEKGCNRGGGTTNHNLSLDELESATNSGKNSISEVAGLIGEIENESKHLVENAALELRDNTEEVINSIMNIGNQ